MSPPYFSHRDVKGDLALTAEVVVIGSGAGGAVVAKELAEAGKDVILLEEGPWLDVKDYGDRSVLDATRLLYRDVGLTASVGQPPVLIPMGRGVGGTTLINLGTALRMLPEHFEKWRQAGLRRLTWDDLQRAYDRVASVIPVETIPDHLIGGNTRKLIEGSRALGLHGHVLDRFASGCEGRARCFVGCPTDGKRSSMHLNYVPRALAAGARLYTECRADRIAVRHGRVIGLDARISAGHDSPTRHVRISTERVVVACGAMISPVFLHRNGISHRHPQAGRNLRVHPACRAIGLFDELVDAHRGVPQAYHVPPTDDREMYVETVFLPPALMAPSLPGFGPDHHQLMKKYRHLALAGLRFIEKGSGTVSAGFGGSSRVDYNLAGPDLETMKSGLVLCAKLLFEAGARKVYVPVHGRERLDGMSDVKALEAYALKASDLEAAGYHAHGTLRMGSDPATSIVDESGQCHTTRGLYVADASIFPASSRVNPQFTVMALATLVAEAIARA